VPVTLARDDQVLELVGVAPGLTYAAAAGRLGGRRVTALNRLRTAVDVGLVHEGTTSVPSRGGRRTAIGLYAGPAPPVPQVLLPGQTVQLKALRERLQLSLADVARQLGVSRGLIGRWEHGSPMPAWAVRDLPAALEDAQTKTRPGRRRDGLRLNALLAQINRDPGVTRGALAGRRLRDLRLLEQARRDGQLHEATIWVGRGRGRQPVAGLFPGRRPRQDTPGVSTAELEQARHAAGWTLDSLARRVGVPATTLAGWLRRYDTIPPPEAARAAVALLQARNAALDDRGAVLQAVTDLPGQSRKRLTQYLGYTRSLMVEQQVAALLAEGAVHQRNAGQRGVHAGLYPGSSPQASLDRHELRALRLRAGLKQAELAERVGSYAVAVSDWETGRRQIPQELQQQLRALLEPLPEGGAPRRQAVIDALAAAPRTRHQLDLLKVGTHGQTTAAVTELLGAGVVQKATIVVPDRDGVLFRRAGLRLNPSVTVRRPTATAHPGSAASVRDGRVAHVLPLV